MQSSQLYTRTYAFTIVQAQDIPTFTVTLIITNAIPAYLRALMDFRILTFIYVYGKHPL